MAEPDSLFMVSLKWISCFRTTRFLTASYPRLHQVSVEEGSLASLCDSGETSGSNFLGYAAKQKPTREREGDQKGNIRWVITDSQKLPQLCCDYWRNGHAVNLTHSAIM